MASDIQISLFSAIPGVGLVALGAMAFAPVGFEDLPYMQPAKLRFFRNASNNSATAAQIGESTSGALSYETTATYWYFAAAVDPAGNEGPRTSGIQVVPKVAVPDGSVTTPKLANNAVTNAKIANLAVDDAKISDLAVEKLKAGIITASILIYGPQVYGGVVSTAGSGARTFLDGSTGNLTSVDSAGNLKTTIAAGGNAAANFIGRGNDNTVRCDALSTGNVAYALRARNTASGGGEAVLGASSGAGGYAVNAITGGVYSPGGYHPFTGMHECLVRKDAELKVGDIACVQRVFAREGLNNVLTEVTRAEAVGDRRAIGVVSEIKDLPLYAPIAALGGGVTNRKKARRRRVLARQYLHVTVNALGEGQMLVCGRGGDIEAGDYVCSSDLSGKGQRQNDAAGEADDLLRRCTVAQTMESVAFDHPDQVKRAAVFYRCG